MFKQLQYQPLSLDKQVIITYAGTSGLMDDVPVEKVGEFEKALFQHMDASQPEIGRSIMETYELPPEREQELDAAIREFKQTAGYGSTADKGAE